MVIDNKAIQKLINISKILIPYHCEEIIFYHQYILMNNSNQPTRKVCHLFDSIDNLFINTGGYRITADNIKNFSNFRKSRSIVEIDDGNLILIEGEEKYTVGTCIDMDDMKNVYHPKWYGNLDTSYISEDQYTLMDFEILDKLALKEDCILDVETPHGISKLYFNNHIIVNPKKIKGLAYKVIESIKYDTFIMNLICIISRYEGMDMQIYIRFISPLED